MNARYPGSTHDAFIWVNSNILNVLTNLHDRGHRNYYLLGKKIFIGLKFFIYLIHSFLLGDSGYPLRTWLLTPLEAKPIRNTPEFNYNMAHKKTRGLIERCNGILKMRFRCLLKHRSLHYNLL